MPSPLESKAALRRLTDAAVETSAEVVSRLTGAPEFQRAVLLEAVPELISYYAEGSAALAADFYEDERIAAGVAGRFTAGTVVADRTVKVRRAVVWAAEPLLAAGAGAVALVGERLAEIVQLETARPYRDTILSNSHQDPQAVGWRRIARATGCRLCRMLADRGAVYTKETAVFATHPHCGCTAQPVFKTDVGEEASVMQYLGSRRTKTSESRARLNAYLDTYY